jgi:hypothetical protein
MARNGPDPMEFVGGCILWAYHLIVGVEFGNRGCEMGPRLTAAVWTAVVATAMIMRWLDAGWLLEQ